MNNTDLDMLASATKQARDSLTDEIYVELWKRIHDATSAYLKHAKVWFDDMPGGRWNVDAAQKTGVMPYVNYATRELTAQISALFRDAAIEVRRRCYLRGIKAAQVNQEIVGEKPAEPLDVVFQPKKESLRINGRAVTVLREAEPTDDSEGRWVTINGAHVFIKGPGEQKSQGATAHHGVPSYRINSNDGGVGPSIQYHGTSAPDFKTFGDDPIYLVDDPSEARGYASTTGVGWGSKGGKERVLAIRRSPGSTLDLDREINDAVVEEDDPNSIIDSLMHRAKSDGYRYVSFVHPGFTSDEQRVLVSLYPKEDLKIVGKIGKKREAEVVLPNLTTIDPRIQGKDLDRVLAIIAKIPPAIRAIPKQIVLADLGAVHGEWENGTILLNPSVFKSKQKFGTHNRISRLEHTLVHEYMHAWGEKAGLDISPEWLALSGWQYSPDETPKGTARYIEKRKGWPKEKTEWVHKKTAWFPRPYSGKSPEEDFADCARDLMVGWDDSFSGGGEAKRDWVRAKLIDVDPGLREAGEWDEEKHPRAPAGSDEGGQFTSGGSGSGSSPEGSGNERKHDKLDTMMYLGPEESAPEIKGDVVSQISTRLDQSDSSTEALLSVVPEIPAGSNRAAIASAVAQHYVDLWAKSSGDSFPEAVAMQFAIQAEFTLDGVQIDHLVAHGQGYDEFYEKHSGVMRAFVRAQYEMTQEYLRTNGISEVIVFRGMSGEEFYRQAGEGSWGEITLQPASSFTSNIDTAYTFAFGEGSVVGVKVPASKILSTFRSGVGTAKEKELVILGGQYKSFAVRVLDQGLSILPKYADKDTSIPYVKKIMDDRL